MNCLSASAGATPGSCSAWPMKRSPRPCSRGWPARLRRPATRPRPGLPTPQARRRETHPARPSRGRHAPVDELARRRPRTPRIHQSRPRSTRSTSRTTSTPPPADEPKYAPRATSSPTSNTHGRTPSAKNASPPYSTTSPPSTASSANQTPTTDTTLPPEADATASAPGCDDAADRRRRRRNIPLLDDLETFESDAAGSVVAPSGERGRAAPGLACWRRVCPDRCDGTLR